MGGVFGGGGSELRAQARREKEELERVEKEKALRAAEKKVKEGQHSAKIKLGAETTEEFEEQSQKKLKKRVVSESLGIGKSGASGKVTGVQL